MIKKIFTIIFSLCIVLNFASCTNNNKSESATINSSKKESALNSKTYKFFKENFDSNEYTMTLKTTDNETGIESIVTIGIKGDIYYTDDNTGSSHQTIFFKDGETTTISHDDKAYYVVVTEDEISSQSEGFSSTDFEGKEFTSGKETINNKEYYFEEFNDEYGVTRYCFDGDNLAYMVNVDPQQSTYIEISNLVHSFDENLLNIPADYELLDY